MTNSNHRSRRAVAKPDKTVEITSFEGIMPDPETLERLEKIIPGCGREWMELAKKEVEHRHKSEDRITWSFKFNTLIGQILAFVSSLAVCLVGFYAIYTGSPTAGATIITGSAATVISAYLVRSRNRAKSSE